MHAAVEYKGRTYKMVRVTGARSSTVEDVLTAAYKAANEEPASTFGYSIRSVTDSDDNPVVLVELYTD